MRNYMNWDADAKYIRNCRSVWAALCDTTRSSNSNSTSQKIVILMIRDQYEDQGVNY
jgi:hypothetical protein